MPIAFPGPDRPGATLVLGRPGTGKFRHLVWPMLEQDAAAARAGSFAVAATLSPDHAQELAAFCRVASVPHVTLFTGAPDDRAFNPLVGPPVPVLGSLQAAFAARRPERDPLFCLVKRHALAAAVDLAGNRNPVGLAALLADGREIERETGWPAALFADLAPAAEELAAAWRAHSSRGVAFSPEAFLSSGGALVAASAPDGRDLLALSLLARLCFARRETPDGPPLALYADCRALAAGPVLPFLLALAADGLAAVVLVADSLLRLGTHRPYREALEAAANRLVLAVWPAEAEEVELDLLGPGAPVRDAALAKLAFIAAYGAGGADAVPPGAFLYRLGQRRGLARATAEVFPAARAR